MLYILIKIEWMYKLHCSLLHAFSLTRWAESVRQTEPNPKYEHVIENILRDKADGWKHDYYRETSTSFDAHVGRAHAEVQRYKVVIKKWEIALEKIMSAIENSQLEASHPKFKKMSPKEVEELEKEYSEAYTIKCQQMVLLDGAEQVCQDLTWKQYTERKRLSLIQGLRNTFMMNADEDYLRRGVTWVENYCTKERK